jgi:hypothetical protein
MSTIAYNLRNGSPSSVHLEVGHARRRHRIEENPSSKAQHLQVGQWFCHNCKEKCLRSPSLITPAHCTFAALVSRIALVAIFTVNSALFWSNMGGFFGINHRLCA